MSNEPPEPGASEPQSPEDPPTRPLPAQPPPPQRQPPQPPQQSPPGYPPPPPVPPYGQPGPYGAPPQQPNPYGQPPQQNNPYAQPQQPPPSQPVWQGHQAPQQQYPPPQGWPGQPPYGAPAKQKGGKGLLIGLLVVLALALVAVAVITALILADDDSGTAVKDISSGDCLVGSGLADAEEEISDLETVDCGEDHDAEVFATFELGDDQDLAAAGSQCVDEAAAAGRSLEDLAGEDLEIRPLVARDEPEEGDKVVCFIRHPDGSKLSGSEFQ